ncbi:MAG: hypothetical protein R6T93_13175 [Trueperaceae bacterium]
MNRRVAGAFLLLAGAATLLGGRGAVGLAAELAWIGGLTLAAVVAWRTLTPRAPLALRIVVHAALGMTAAATTTQLSGPAFLGFAAVAFWLVYRTPTHRQAVTGWAIIPAGVLTTLAAVAAVDALRPGWDGGAVFLLGMTATFTAIYLLPREHGGGRWALWPALAWALLTVLANDPTGAFTRWWLPLTMIGVGVAVLGWTRRGR